MLDPGTPAPAIAARTLDGEEFVLGEALADARVLLYFYPKSNTSL